ncbi:MAG: glycosyltransferase [Methylacidiphilales bacterium]|nr:glycosyltransferase [Candidatus Methylacidiphilales bacterium]
MSTFLHLTSWLSSAGGGIPPVIQALTTEYRRQHLDGLVAGLVDPTGAPPVFPSDWPVVTGRITGPTAFGYSPELARQLRRCVRKDTLIQVHGLWMYPGWLARKLSEATGAVRIVSPHGMLEPWALKNARWKKQLAACAFEKKNLRTASCLHALCASEAENFRCYGLENPIAIIPNGVDIPNHPNLEGESRKPAWEEQVGKGQKILLYLGRLHPKKGLINLLQAWARVKEEESREPAWMLALAGWDQLGHQEELREIVAKLHLQSSVIFTGPQFDEAKSACYQNCDAFILPSLSEGLPLVVLEAWSYGKPVLMTSQCNLPEGFTAHAALRIEPGTESIAEGLRQLLKMSDTERQSMGQRGLTLVKDRFTWSKIAIQMRSVHEWLLGGGSRPKCVTIMEEFSR